MNPASWIALADAVLVVHTAIVLFVVLGLVLVVAGNLRAAPGWPWVNRPWFRALHALAIGVVVAEAWLGVECPLTTLEWWLRAQAGDQRGAPGFIEYWLHRLLYVQAPGWVFTLAYSAFGLAVAAAWWRWPPRR